jgi:Flp pilus assembly protein TadD
LVKAASTSPTTLQHAHASAALASSLDPLSDAGLRAEATIALHQGQVAQARTYVLRALRREPSDAQAWIQLEFVDFELRDTRGAVQAASRAIALDPRGPFASQRSQVSLLATPPQESATAVQTPLHPR